MNIILFKDKENTGDGTANYYVDELAKELNIKGHNINIIDLENLRKEIEEDTLEEVCKNDNKERITIENKVKNIFEQSNNIDLVLSLDGMNCLPIDIYEDLDIVLGIILTKHPFTSINQIMKYKSYVTFITMIDEEMLETFTNYIDNLLMTFCVLLGGSKIKTIEEDKKYDVVICGSLNKDFKENIQDSGGFKDTIWDETFELLYKISSEKYISQNLDEKLDCLIFGTEIESDYYKNSLDKYLNELIDIKKSSSIIRNSSEEKEYIAKIYNVINDIYINQNMYNIVLKLLEDGVKVDYFGELKTDDFNSYPNFVNHGVTNHKEVILHISKSKIFVNNSPYFKNGSSELINSAMLNKVLVFSNINNYSNNVYKNKENILFFDINKLNDLTNKVKYYLNNEKERNEIIRNAYNTTLKYNTWEKSADKILEAYEMTKENL